MSANATFSPGDKVAVIQVGRMNTTARIDTVERVTKTQYVLASGRRFRVENLREVGNHYGDSITALDTPEAVVAIRNTRRANLASKVVAEFYAWNRVTQRNDFAPLSAAVAALDAFDAENA